MRCDNGVTFTALSLHSALKETAKINFVWVLLVVFCDIIEYLSFHGFFINHLVVRILSRVNGRYA